MAIFWSESWSSQIPEAPESLLEILGTSANAVQHPIRSEIFGLQGFALHGRNLGLAHRATTPAKLVRQLKGLARNTTFFPRLKSNIITLRAAHRYLNAQTVAGHDISPAAEWLLDNFHLIEAQLKEVHEGLPRGYYGNLPVLDDQPLAGLPRIYGVAWAYVAHTDGAFDEESLVHFLCAYQESQPLDLGELWALPTTLRVVLIENLRRLAERVSFQSAAREIANICCDKIESHSARQLDQLLSRLARLGVGRTFVAQMAQRLQDRWARANGTCSPEHEEWLHVASCDYAISAAQQNTDQAADNLSVRNAVTSLRTIGDAQWTDIVEESSALTRLMLSSGLFAAESLSTRDTTLRGIERISRTCRRDEVVVAQALLDLMARPRKQPEVASFWLTGPGRPKLIRALGCTEGITDQVRSLLRPAKLSGYIATSVCATFALVAWILSASSEASGTSANMLELSVLAVLMFFPASEAIVALTNRLISEAITPLKLPRMALLSGVPEELRVMVVIPSMLSHEQVIRDLCHRLLLHYLANPEPNAQFAILSDWTDANEKSQPADQALLASMIDHIRKLNADYPVAPGAVPRFIVLHRERTFSSSEQCWIGRERKRGKLEQLIGALAHLSEAPRTVMIHSDDLPAPDHQGAFASGFVDLGRESQMASGTRFILTLDSDTQLPPGRLRELVAVAAHPQNQARLNAAGNRVVSGYGIFQPRVATPLAEPDRFTRFHWLFSGQCGIDPYSAASSEVYQDLFGEGTFTGKGLMDVSVMHAVLAGRLPDGAVLSHDLLEGSIAHCAAVSDIALLESAPFHADVAASRAHRWTRGDWQLLPFLLRPARYSLSALSVWKMCDNLRRSLVAPMSLAMLAMCVGGTVVSPWTALALIFTAYSAGPLIGTLAGLANHRETLSTTRFLSQAATDLVRAVGGALWHIAQLPSQALLSVDAIARALYRTLISRRHMLQWTTADSATAKAQSGMAALWRIHWKEPALAFTLMAWLVFRHTSHPALSVLLGLTWCSSPLWTWWGVRTRPSEKLARPDPADEALLQDIARDTWRFFERCVTPGDRFLPPDNLQTRPFDMVAHRTSPTNIGLYMLSAACAREFGWIGSEDLVQRLEDTLNTLDGMQRHHGHLYNWYDTQTAMPLLPMYVSTVDSGNLSGHLLAVAQACLELAGGSVQHEPGRSALARAAARVRRQIDDQPEITMLADDSLQFLAINDPMLTARQDPGAFANRLEQFAAAVSAMTKSEMTPGVPATGVREAASPRVRIGWYLTDYLATLRSALRDTRVDWPNRKIRLERVAKRCQEMAWLPDFRFLYHRKRHLLHIGYRVAEQQLDTSFYDLMASETRLTSLLAIAKGDVPVSHWATLGRPFFALGSKAGLRSWSGSMFEYLMPGLVLTEPEGGMLHEACHVAMREQVEFSRGQGVPWGISESAYSGRDHTLAYQYSPQGVPRLALRRTPADELVIAPYATALAAQINPHEACNNFRSLENLVPRTRYGLVESIDFTAARQTEGETFTPVYTFMSHHQGMSIVALANTLLDRCAQRWAMSAPPIEAVSSLLQERAPREVPALMMMAPSPLLNPASTRSPALLRDVTPGLNAIEPTHLLSNGTYSVSLRANGAGWSRWGSADLTRWRDDALRDAYGSFLYLRWDRQPQPVSVTQHPAPDPAAHYHSVYHPDRIRFEAIWPTIQAHTTVWVSPEDDIEFRQIDLTNSGTDFLDIEVLSAFEPTLSAPGADDAHPAFNNLFLRTHWLAEHEALLLSRTPRLATERPVFAAHFLAQGDPQVRSVQYQTDRRQWLGRNGTASHPLAAFRNIAPASPGKDEVHAAGTSEAAASSDAMPSASALDTGLDPVCALAVRLHIAPGARIQLTFATAASDDRARLETIIDKYRQTSHIQRASLMSSTLASIRLRTAALNPESLAAIYSATTALVMTLARPGTMASREEASGLVALNRQRLWRFGISGDRPFVLVTVGIRQGLGLVRTLTKALQLWGWGGVACDLVIINSEATSYEMSLQRELSVMRDAHQPGNGNAVMATNTGFHVLRADELGPEELVALHALASLSFLADGRPLVHHLQAWIALHESDFEARHEGTRTELARGRSQALATQASQGEFAAGTGAFQFPVSALQRPARPWINVLSNPNFGAQISESGGGYTWAINSRLNQISAWSNDPVSDTPSEWFVLQNALTLESWSLTPSAWCDPARPYQVSHGQGYSQISHRFDDVQSTATWCVDTDTSVKQCTVRLVNTGNRTLHLRLVGAVEWVMGAQRRDRRSTLTLPFRQRLRAGEGVSAAMADHKSTSNNSPATQKLTALLCSQQEHSAGFGKGTAFFASVAPAADDEDWTCDRRELFDARGSFVLPTHFSMRNGRGLDPCAAIGVRVTLAPGETLERVFLLGYAATPEAASQLAADTAQTAPESRLGKVRQHWDELLGATEVRTPDPLFDALVNRWLLYQAVSCRLWAKAGFYQAGGATGFRDQLQDAMALSWASPDTLRQQIAVAASRQFPEGDVQHWWHAPTGAGVRTHFSDDLLWLAYACIHYVRATGDLNLLNQQVPFIEGPVIVPGAEDAYYVPVISEQQASIFEHAARAIDHSLATGAHGLPLMGTGDWNDGMNRVGHLGRGESVWMGWFLCSVVAGFAPLARARGEHARAARWEKTREALKVALEAQAWDGEWYKRAYFDEGQALGSHLNNEARIDLIAQAWSVLSGEAPAAHQAMAMASLEQHLVDHEAGLIRLLTPPLEHADPSAGYIQAYPPGVRENGGQYSHAAIWGLMAQAALARQANGVADEGANGLAHALTHGEDHIEAAYRYFTMLSPAHRAAHPVQGPLYEIEPYVMAGDICSHPPYTGRGGWSWYTGAAAWMHRAALESIFGLDMNADTLCFRPCFPASWNTASLSLRRDGHSMHFKFHRVSALGEPGPNENLLEVGEDFPWRSAEDGAHYLIALR